MSLHQTILSDLTAAMKAKDSETVAVLRLLKSALLNVAKEGSAGKDGDDVGLSDEIVLSVVQKEAKKRKESIAAFEAGGREDLAKIERQELETLSKYLPEELSVEEVKALLAPLVAAADSAEFGPLMGQAMGAVKGQADGNVVRTVLQDLLNTAA